MLQGSEAEDCCMNSAQSIVASKNAEAPHTLSYPLPLVGDACCSLQLVGTHKLYRTTRYFQANPVVF